MSRTIAAAALSLTLSASALAAQDGGPTISLELNKATALSDDVCEVVFVGRNGLEQDFAEVTWRLAVFGADGVFRNLLALPLGALPAGKGRVVRYNLPTPCGELSEILVNDSASCTIAGSDAPSDVCLTQLTVTTRTDIGFGL